MERALCLAAEYAVGDADAQRLEEWGLTFCLPLSTFPRDRIRFGLGPNGGLECADGASVTATTCVLDMAREGTQGPAGTAASNEGKGGRIALELPWPATWRVERAKKWGAECWVIHCRLPAAQGRVALTMRLDMTPAPKRTPQPKPRPTPQAMVHPRGRRVVALLSDDVQTRGDWPTAYGDYAYVLCAMWQYNVCGGPGWPFPLKIYGGDPKDRPKRYIWRLSRPLDGRALWNPKDRTRTPAVWDDHGEVYPLGKGPNLYVDLAVPDGDFVLSLYFFEVSWPQYRNHRLRILDEHRKPLASASVADYYDGVFKRFLVAGPRKITLETTRGYSPNAVLSGLFLDQARHAFSAVLAEGRLLRPTGQRPRAKRLRLLLAALEAILGQDDEQTHWRCARSQDKLAAIVSLAEELLSAGPHDTDVPWAKWLLWQGHSGLLQAQQAASSVESLIDGRLEALPATDRLAWLAAALADVRLHPSSHTRLALLNRYVQASPPTPTLCKHIDALAFLHLLRGQDDRALSLYTKAAGVPPMGPRQAWSQFMAGQIEYAHGADGPAEALFEDLMESAGESFEARVAQAAPKKPSLISPERLGRTSSRAPGRSSSHTPSHGRRRP